MTFILRRMNTESLLKWLRQKLTEAEGALKRREEMEIAWRGGTDRSWKAAGCRMTKAQRLQESGVHGRIAVKCRYEVEMFKATIAAITLEAGK